VAISKSPLPFVFWSQPASGNEPAREWLQGLDKEDRRKMGSAMRTVQFGWPLGMPLYRPMSGGLHELRVSLKGKQEARLLFWVHDETIVGLHAFFKTTPATPKSELELATRRMKAMQPRPS
jgi:phage-related protein